jgi:hypothetical protein
MREFLLGNQWLEEAVECFSDQGWSTEQITDYANAWSNYIVNYACYLTEEGYSAKETAKIVNESVEQADYDLSRMPIIPGEAN